MDIGGVFFSFLFLFYPVSVVDKQRDYFTHLAFAVIPGWGRRFEQVMEYHSVDYPDLQYKIISIHRLRNVLNCSNEAGVNGDITPWVTFIRRWGGPHSEAEEWVSPSPPECTVDGWVW